METEKLIENRITKDSLSKKHLLAFRVCDEIKSMEMELKSRGWDIAEISRIAIRKAFLDAMDVDRKRGFDEKA